MIKCLVFHDISTLRYFKKLRQMFTIFEAAVIGAVIPLERFSIRSVRAQYQNITVFS